MLNITKLIICRKVSIDFAENDKKLSVEGRGVIIDKNCQSGPTPSIRQIYIGTHQYGERKIKLEIKLRRVDLVEGSIEKPKVLGFWDSNTACYFICDDPNQLRNAKEVLAIYNKIIKDISEYEFSGNVANYIYSNEIGKDGIRGLL